MLKSFLFSVCLAAHCFRSHATDALNWFRCLFFSLSLSFHYICEFLRVYEWMHQYLLCVGSTNPTKVVALDALHSAPISSLQWMLYTRIGTDDESKNKMNTKSRCIKVEWNRRTQRKKVKKKKISCRRRMHWIIDIHSEKKIIYTVFRCSRNRTGMVFGVKRKWRYGHRLCELKCKKFIKFDNGNN